MTTRDPPPQNVDYFDSNPDPDAGKMFKVENFDTDIPDNPNGVYIQGPRFVNGHPVTLCFEQSVGESV